jgi:hypothetical protein
MNDIMEAICVFEPPASLLPQHWRWCSTHLLRELKSFARLRVQSSRTMVQSAAVRSFQTTNEGSVAVANAFLCAFKIIERSVMQKLIPNAQARAHTHTHIHYLVADLC